MNETGLQKDKWTTIRKILFRFVFPFFILEIFTEEFADTLMGESNLIDRLADSFFAKPLIWLNHHLFHFPYYPRVVIISGTLTTIRHICYLVISLAACIIWTLADRKRDNYNRLNYWASGFFTIMLSMVMFSFGIHKLYPVQMPMPGWLGLQKTFGEAYPKDLLWYALAYGKPYQIFTGIIEIIGALAILVRKTKPAGLLLIISVLLNIIILDYSFIIGVLDLAILLLLISLYLLAPYARSLYLFFFSNNSISLHPEYVPVASKRATQAATIFAVLILAYSFRATTIHAYHRYKELNDLEKSRRYSLVTKFITGNDSLSSGIGKSMQWKTWDEFSRYNKQMVTIAPGDLSWIKTYEISRDSVNHLLTLKPVGGSDTSKSVLHYYNIDETNWKLEGIMNHTTISASLKKVQPDTILRLFSIRRTFIPIDAR